MQRVAVIGAGTMGHGIAQVAAMAGCSVALFDASATALDKALASVRANLDGGVSKGKVLPDVRDRAIAGLRGVSVLAEAVADADLVVEAIPENLQWKQDLFRSVEAAAPSSAVFATNTSSLSVAGIASVLADPGRVVGAHFFNPVHLMPLLEIVRAEATRPEVVEAMRLFGVMVGKEVIIVRDFPGFATSRLGVCLGMEAIRMVEQGVASPEDIDKAMVLGYKHPVGPLRLTDMVGLDVRLAIGEYLAQELGNSAFEPPALMRQMVAEGLLGKKSGRGFYSW